jgi:hypothetical protein
VSTATMNAAPPALSPFAGHASKGGNYETCPAGNHPAHLVAIYDLGTHDGEYQGDTKFDTRQALVSRVGAFRRDEGRRNASRHRQGIHGPSRRTGASLLAGPVEPPTDARGLAGNQVPPGEAIDPMAALGKPCLFNVTNSTNKDKTYANIDGVKAMARGLHRPGPGITTWWPTTSRWASRRSSPGCRKSGGGTPATWRCSRTSFACPRSSPAGRSARASQGEGHALLGSQQAGFQATAECRRRRHPLLRTERGRAIPPDRPAALDRTDGLAPSLHSQGIISLSLFAGKATDEPATTPDAPIDWSALKAEICSRLDLVAEYEAMGVRLQPADARREGLRECHAIGRPDESPSAVRQREDRRLPRLRGRGGVAPPLRLRGQARRLRPLDRRG